MKVILLLTVICSTASATSLRASDASEETPPRRLNIHTDSFITDIAGVIKTETFREGVTDEEQPSDQLELLLKPRLVGKSTEIPGEYPYFCRIDKNFFPSCAGTLVAPDVVLTNAANCKTDDASQLRILINGLHDDIHEVVPDERYRTVTEMKVHPDFSAETYHNDLMLLKLNEPVPDDIPFVELNRDSTRPALDEGVTVMGLGAMYQGRGYPDLLQSVQVDMISNDFCSAAYEDVGLFSVNDDVMLCAGKRTGAPGNACQRDAGGPLITKEGVQVGVISYGLGCEREEFPGVYSRTVVRKGKDWLGKTLCSMTDTGALKEWCTRPITNEPKETPQDASSQKEVASKSAALEAPKEEAPKEEEPKEEASKESCQDEPNGVFKYYWREKTCDWLSSSTSPSERSDYCKEGSDARKVCQKTCGSCGEIPKDASSPQKKPIAVAPIKDTTVAVAETEPEVEAVMEGPCIDKPGAKFKDDRGKEQDCPWLRKANKKDVEQYCQAGSEAWDACRVVCGRCADEECVDNDDVEWNYRGRNKTCNWLRSKDKRRQNKPCKEEEEAFGVCRKTCGQCE